MNKTKTFTIFLTVISLIVAVFAHVLPARAAIKRTVNSLNDPGNGFCDAVECTLREAISTSAPRDLIDFSVSGTIQLASQLVITKPLTILGPGASNLVLSGRFLTRVLSVNSPTYAVNISGLTIANGYIEDAPINDGAGLLNQGVLSLNSVVFDYNTGSGTNGGGAIYNTSAGTLTIVNSAFIENLSSTHGGAIANYGSLNITNSTVAYNLAYNGNGGGIYNVGILTANNVTVAGNTATNEGSGIYNGIVNGNPTLTLKNSIIANDSVTDCYNAAVVRPPTVAGNLIVNNAAGANACGMPAVTDDPMLTDLDYYGASTPIFGLLAGSPAIDAAHDPSCAATDQRGVPRPQGPHCDIGAFEATPAPTVTVEQAAGQSDPSAASPIHFTVTFSQDVTGFASNDVSLGGSAGATTVSISGSGATYDVAVSGMTGTGTVTASVVANAAFNADGLGNSASTSVDNSVTYQSFPYPVVQSIVHASANPTSRASVSYTVTFTQAVTGVDISDFAITATDLSGANVASVTGSGATYTVSVNTGIGNGTIRLDVSDDDSIVNGSLVPLGGVGVGNGDFLTGETYTVNKMLSFTSASAQDGYILESGENTSSGGSVNSVAPSFIVGDDAAKRQFRGLLSFNTSSLPDNAVVQAVRLKVKQQSVTGSGDPFVLLNGLALDIRLGYFGTSAGLQTTDFQAASSGTQVFPTPALVSSWYTLELDAGLFPFVNLLATVQSGLTQLRLRFKLDDNNNGTANYITFYSGNTATASDRPILEVYYYVP